MDWTAILSAVIVGLITAGFGWWFRRQSNREHRQTGAEIQEIRVLVNGRLQEALDKCKRLNTKRGNQ